MNLTDFLKSNFAKNVLGFNGTNTMFHTGERDRIIVSGNKVFFRSYWDNGKQASSKSIPLNKADNIDVSLTRKSSMNNGHTSNSYWLNFKSPNSTISFLVPNRALKNGKLENTYEMKVIQKGPWYDENYKEVKSSEAMDEEVEFRRNKIMTLRQFIMEQSEGVKPEDAEMEVDKKEDSDGKFEFLVKVKVDGESEADAKSKLSDALSEFDAKIKAKKSEKKEEEPADDEEEVEESYLGEGKIADVVGLTHLSIMVNKYLRKTVPNWSELSLKQKQELAVKLVNLVSEEIKKEDKENSGKKFKKKGCCDDEGVCPNCGKVFSKCTCK